MPKPITEEGLEKDLDYIVNGTHVSAALAEIFPPHRGASILEPGCGSGKLGMGYWLAGCNATLVDLDPEVLAYTRALEGKLRKMWAPKHGEKLEIVQGSIFELDPEMQYDFVFNEGVSHQWPQSDPRRQQSIDCMARAARPSGTVAIIGSNADCPEMMEYARRVKHTFLGMPPEQEPFTREELAARMMESGLTGVKVAPVGDYWEKSLLLAGWGKKP